MKRFFGWVFLVFLGVGGLAYGIRTLISPEKDQSRGVGIGFLITGAFWTWLGGSYMLGLF